MNKTLPLLVVLTLVSLALAGCFTPPGGAAKPTQFYRMDYSPKTPVDAVEKKDAKVLVKVCNGQVLHGPKMILASSDYELRYEESQRWAQSPASAMAQILTMALRERYTDVQTLPVPTGYRPDFRVNVTIEKLWGTARGEVVLAVTWQVTDGKSAMLAEGRKEFVKTGWRVGDYRQFAERVSGLMPQVVEAVLQTLSSLDAAPKNS